MNRRQFVVSTLSAAAAPAGGVASAAGAVTLKGLRADMPLEDRIRTIQSFVHNRYYDANGLLYSHINFEEERPHTARDLAGADPNNLGIPKEDLENYENS